MVVGVVVEEDAAATVRTETAGLVRGSRAGQLVAAEARKAEAWEAASEVAQVQEVLEGRCRQWGAGQTSLEVLWEGKEEVKTDLVAPKAAVKMG